MITDSHPRVTQAGLSADRREPATPVVAGLAAHLIVKGITYNVPRYRYGKYRLWAEQRRSRYFDVEASPQSESIIRSLSIRADGRHLGQSFQGNAAVRELTPADDLLLAQAGVGLPVIQTAEFYPEDELEARVVYGAEIRIEEVAAGAPARTRYLYDKRLPPCARLTQCQPCSVAGLRLRPPPALRRRHLPRPPHHLGQPGR